MSSIFISYSHMDTEFVGELVTGLKIVFKGDIWWDGDLELGTKFETEIPIRIQNSKVFLFIVSENSLDSEWCRKEFDIANNNRDDITIIPLIIIENFLDKQDNFSNLIHPHQYSDFSSGIIERKKELQLHGRIVSLLSKTGELQEIKTTPPQPKPDSTLSEKDDETEGGGIVEVEEKKPTCRFQLTIIIALIVGAIILGAVGVASTVCCISPTPTISVESCATDRAKCVVIQQVIISGNSIEPDETLDIVSGDMLQLEQIEFTISSQNVSILRAEQGEGYFSAYAFPTIDNVPQDNPSYLQITGNPSTESPLLSVGPNVVISNAGPVWQVDETWNRLNIFIMHNVGNDPYQIGRTVIHLNVIQNDE